jgi:hypothetical protein
MMAERLPHDPACRHFNFRGGGAVWLLAAMTGTAHLITADTGTYYGLAFEAPHGANHRIGQSP